MAVSATGEWRRRVRRRSRGRGPLRRPRRLHLLPVAPFQQGAARSYDFPTKHTQHCERRWGFLVYQVVRPLNWRFTMVFPSLSPFAGPLVGAGQPTRSEPPQDRGSGSPSSLNSPRRASQLQRWDEGTSRCPRLLLRATPNPRFSAVPALNKGPWAHRRSLPGHTAHHHFGRRARCRAHLQQQRREQRRKRIASANVSAGEPGDDSGGQAPGPFSSRRTWGTRSTAAWGSTQSPRRSHDLRSAACTERPVTARRRGLVVHGVRARGDRQVRRPLRQVTSSSAKRVGPAL